MACRRRRKRVGVIGRSSHRHEVSRVALVCTGRTPRSRKSAAGRRSGNLATGLWCDCRTDRVDSTRMRVLLSSLHLERSTRASTSTSESSSPRIDCPDFSQPTRTSYPPSSACLALGNLAPAAPPGFGTGTRVTTRVSTFGAPAQI